METDSDKSIIYLECECECHEHLLRIRSYEDDEYVYIEHYLNPVGGFITRLRIALKYIFNMKCKFGAFDETMVEKKKFKELVNKI